MKKLVLVLSVITSLSSVSMADYEGSYEHMNDLCKIAAAEINMETEQLFKQIFGVEYTELQNPTETQKAHYNAIYAEVAKAYNEDNKGLCN